MNQCLLSSVTNLIRSVTMSVQSPKIESSVSLRAPSTSLPPAQPMLLSIEAHATEGTSDTSDEHHSRSITQVCFSGQARREIGVEGAGGGGGEGKETSVSQDKLAEKIKIG